MNWEIKKGETTILVSGLGRCGTSMMMQILDAGGFPTAGEYPAFEEDIMSELPTSGPGWKELSKGKAIKALDPHRWTPPSGDYYCIWMSRDFSIQALSQAKFLQLLKPDADIDLKHGLGDIVRSLVRDTRAAKKKLIEIGCIQIEEFRYEEMLMFPEESINRITSLLGGLNEEAMVNAIVSDRTPLCYPGLMEFNQVSEKGTKNGN